MAYCPRFLLRSGRRLPLLGFAVASLIGPGPLTSPVLAEIDTVGGKGAQVYCFMRSNGNNHEVSWTAAYALINYLGRSARWRVSAAERLEGFAVRHWVIWHSQIAAKRVRR